MDTIVFLETVQIEFLIRELNLSGTHKPIHDLVVIFGAL
jgi:hypothetical protein